MKNFRAFSTTIFTVIGSLALAQNMESNLFVGARSGQVAAIRSLVASGRVNVNVHDDHGFTPLMIAANAGWQGVVRVLVDAGATVDFADKRRETALILAAQRGRPTRPRFCSTPGPMPTRRMPRAAPPGAGPRGEATRTCCGS